MCTGQKLFKLISTLLSTIKHCLPPVSSYFTHPNYSRGATVNKQLSAIPFICPRQTASSGNGYSEVCIITLPLGSLLETVKELTHKDFKVYINPFSEVIFELFQIGGPDDELSPPWGQCCYECDGHRRVFKRVKMLIIIHNLASGK